MALKDLLSSESTDSQKKPNKSKTGYVDLEEASRMLNLSIYRTRQLYWEGRLGIGEKEGKKLYVKRQTVEEYGRVRISAKSENQDLERRRLGKRVLKSIETVEMVIAIDKGVNDETKLVLKDLLIKWKEEAEELSKE